MTLPNARCWLLIAGCFLCADLGAPAMAQGRGRSGTSAIRNRINQMIKSVQNDIKQVEQQLKTAQQELSQSSQAYSVAHSAYKQSQDDMREAKKTQAERIGPTVGLPDAIAAVEKAKAAYDEAVTQALPDLQKTTDYQKARQTLDEAEARLAEVRKDARKDQLATASREVQDAREAHRKVIDEHPPIKPLKEAFTKAEEHLTEVRQKYHAALKHDDKLAAAESAFRRNKTAYSQAKAALLVSEEKVAALQERLVEDHMLIGR